jgi:glucose-1-phosphate thymidylyltransferase
MDDTTIGSHSRIVDTVVGERSTLADHISVSSAPGIMEIEGCFLRSEFGAILGDNVTSGPFTVFQNGIVGNNATIERQARIITRTVPDGSLVI